MLRSLSLAAALALLIGPATGPASAQTPGHTRNSVDLEFVDTDPCTGESVYIQGTAVADVQTVTNAQRTIFTVHTRTEGRGFGLESETPYLYRGNELNRTVAEAAGFPRSTMVEQRFRIITQGAADNSFLIFRYRLIQDATGAVVVELEDSRLECR